MSTSCCSRHSIEPCPERLPVVVSTGFLAQIARARALPSCGDGADRDSEGHYSVHREAASRSAL
jgi:hypothetical protein